MDHSWGRNVFAEGVGGIGATLAARVQGLPGQILVTNGFDIPGTYFYFTFVPDMESDEKYRRETGIHGGGHFPFGHLVVPDEPV